VSNERIRNLRVMHIHFVRAVWRWLEDPDSWEARTHLEFAVTYLELAQDEMVMVEA
jgi:hypothetical protein